MEGKTMQSSTPQFYVGWGHPVHAERFDRCMISVNAIEARWRKRFRPNHWILDSGAFTNLTRFGKHKPLYHYAQKIWEVGRIGMLEAAVGQDYMCEPFVIKKTGLDVREHQRLTIERYHELRAVDCISHVYIMPVLQGFEVDDYVRHLQDYQFESGLWVGVGSVCKRNSTNPDEVIEILDSIKQLRPDLRLHGFGIKKTLLSNQRVRSLLHSTDSMAWRFEHRWDLQKGKTQDNGINERIRRALKFIDEVNHIAQPKRSPLL